jgi:glycerol-3-phosphate dehydrogenase
MLVNGRLNEETRRESLKLMQSGFLDLLIVGGGITGVGAALDAAVRGLRVALIEQSDLAAGTSSKSSKLIHGGLRYLEQLNFSLVREALRERGLLLNRIAPHLVQPVPFLLPLRHRVWERAYLGAGVMLYDRLGGARHLPSGRHLSRTSVARIASGLRTDAYVGGVQFWDAQVDDARYVTFVARTAAAHGAFIATGVKATDLTVTGGRVTGVHATDTDSGQPYVIRARHVATALGPWAGELVPEGSTGSIAIRPSKGVHIVLPKSAIDLDTGVVARTPTGLLFVIPWEGYWLVGDTDTEWDAKPDLAVAARADVEILLDRLNSQLKSAITASQVLGVFAGLRPLVAADPSVDTVKLSREHAISSPMQGMSAIRGGKFTTYRAMAAQLVDAAVEDLRSSDAARSTTATTPLLGAEGFSSMWRDRERIAANSGLPIPTIERLLRRYGSCVTELLEIMLAGPDLRRVVEPGTDTLAAEIVYSGTHEGARHLDDVLCRRTRIAIQTPDHGDAVTEHALALMAQTLGWSNDVVEHERMRYQQLLAREWHWLASEIDGSATPTSLSNNQFAFDRPAEDVRTDELNAQRSDI